jgi:rubrerythrin
MEKRFQRRIENFTCEHCGKTIEGTGYTDHCSECLWSKHVDINPGDRKAKCGGALEPIGVEVKTNDYIIHYKCKECNFVHRVKADKKDNIDAIIALCKKPF